MKVTNEITLLEEYDKAKSSTIPAHVDVLRTAVDWANQVELLMDQGDGFEEAASNVPFPVGLKYLGLNIMMGFLTLVWEPGEKDKEVLVRRLVDDYVPTQAELNEMLKVYRRGVI